MSRIPLRASVLVLAATHLAGCSSFMGIHFARHDHPTPHEAPAPALAANTEAGRAELATGQTGLAIESFQKALTSGEPIAPALNGMGVAFARLGRYDLARRFFEEAMATDPSDGRYADNMTRLMRSPALAMRHDADIAASAAPAEAAPPAPAQAEARPAAGQLERVSRAEVRITTLPAAPARVAGEARAASAQGFKPLVRVEFADHEAARSGVVRIELPESKGAAPVQSSSSREEGAKAIAER